MMTTDRADRIALLHELLAERILIFDGAMGTSIQDLRLVERDFRADILADHPVDLLGNNDMLSLTRPDIIAEIHRSFAAAGANLLCTNTFNSTTISQADYDTEHLARKLNVAGARATLGHCQQSLRSAVGTVLELLMSLRLVLVLWLAC